MDVVVEDQGDGSYLASYGPLTDPGAYTLGVKVDGEDVADSPRSFDVAAKAEPKKCFAEGPGLDGNKGTGLGDSEGAPVTMLVHAADKNGEPVAGADVVVEVRCCCCCCC